LEKCFPEDKSLSPIEMSMLNEFFKKRGLDCRIGYLIKKELNQELISRIKKYYNEVFQDLVVVLDYKSGRLIKNKYYEMVYAILDHHHFGIASKRNKLTKLSFSRFAEIFEVNRKTTSTNQNVTDIYSSKRYKLKKDKDDELRYIFDKIEKIILVRDIDEAQTEF
jgi:hypothetical protein